MYDDGKKRRVGKKVRMILRRQQTRGKDKGEERISSEKEKNTGREADTSSNEAQ